MSKELKALEQIGKIPTYWENNILVKDFQPEYYAIVEQALKALEIIKRNPELIISDIYTYNSWEEWCEDWVPDSESFNNKEEFELVKEILK